LNRQISKEVQIVNKHEKMLIFSQQGNANQNVNEISSHTSQNGYHQKPKNNKCWQGCVEMETLMHCWW
jgi:hypothetical protein